MKYLIILFVFTGCQTSKLMTEPKFEGAKVTVRCPEYPQYFHTIHREDIKKYQFTCPRKKKSNLP